MASTLGRRRDPVLGALALVGAVWAAFLLPPQLVAWDGAAAPDWAHGLADTPPYELLAAAAAEVGMTDEYAVFGALIAVSFVLIGVPLIALARTFGRWTGALGVTTVLTGPLSIVSYAGHDADPPWRHLWGAEIPMLLVIGLIAIPAGVFAYRRHRQPAVKAALLGATLLVLVVSTVVFGYVPHGSLVGYGVGVAFLAAGPVRRLRPAHGCRRA